MVGKENRRGGRRVIAAAPPRRSQKTPIFENFFYGFSSISHPLLTSNTQIPKSQLYTSRSNKEQTKTLPYADSN